MINECTIYDFETLSQDTQKGVVTSFALLSFSENRYISNPYTYEELVESCAYIKFDVEEQVRSFKRTMSKQTVDWWAEQGAEAKKQISPSSEDVSIRDLYKFLCDNIDLKNHKKAYTRGNTFDPIFLDSILKQCNLSNPMHWRTIRDTRSMIEGMSFGMNLDNGFTPGELVNKFVKHDPRHDIAMDVMRMQLLAQAIGVQ
jgi:hypothetical protein